MPHHMKLKLLAVVSSTRAFVVFTVRLQAVHTLFEFALLVQVLPEGEVLLVAGEVQDGCVVTGCVVIACVVFG